jgi:hypothetical protein
MLYQEKSDNPGPNFRSPIVNEQSGKCDELNAIFLSTGFFTNDLSSSNRFSIAFQDLISCVLNESEKTCYITFQMAMASSRSRQVSATRHSTYVAGPVNLSELSI